MSIYFGFSPASFTVTAGSVVVPSTMQQDKIFHVDPETPCEILGEKKTLLVPDVPAKDISARDLLAGTTTELPPSLKQPLLKSQTKALDIQGYHSGRRSALVWIDGTWYRLKGCGDLTDGITTRDVEDKPQYLEIRGVQFENTSVREICIFSKTEANLY